MKCTLCGGAGWVDCNVNAAYVMAGMDDSCPKCNGTGELPKPTLLDVQKKIDEGDIIGARAVFNAGIQFVPAVKVFEGLGDFDQSRRYVLKSDYDEIVLERNQQKDAHESLRRYYQAVIKELYEIFDIDGSDGEYRFKWVALEASSCMRELKELRKKHETL